MASKINTNSFFNRREGDKADIALQMASESFNISNALQAQVSSIVKDISAFQTILTDNDSLIKTSFLDMQVAFDSLSNTVSVLSDEVDAITNLFLKMSEIEAQQVKAASIKVFQQQDALQKQRKKTKKKGVGISSGSKTAKEKDDEENPIVRIIKALIGLPALGLMGIGGTVAAGVEKGLKESNNESSGGILGPISSNTEDMVNFEGNTSSETNKKPVIEPVTDKETWEKVYNTFWRETGGITLKSKSKYDSKRVDLPGVGYVITGANWIKFNGQKVFDDKFYNLNGEKIPKKEFLRKIADLNTKFGSRTYLNRHYLPNFNEVNKTFDTTNNLIKNNTNNSFENNTNNTNNTSKSFLEGYVDNAPITFEGVTYKSDHPDYKVIKEKIKDKIRPKINTMGDQSFMKQITDPLSNQNISMLDAIEIPGTNTTSQENIGSSSPNRDDAGYVGTTPVSGTSCPVKCINSFKSNSAYNMNIT